MANEVALFGSGSGSVGATDTRYFSIATATGVSSSEANQQIKMRNPGTLSKLRVNIGTNTINTGNSTVKSRIEGADGNIAISIGSGLTGWFEDNSNSDSISAGQKVCFQIIGSGSTGSLDPLGISCQFVPSGTYRGILMTGNSAGGSSTLSQNSTQWILPTGWIGPISTESQAYNKMSAAGTWKNAQVRVTSNSLDVTATVTSRVNGGAGNQSISVGAGLTGWFEDNSNSDTISAGDSINYQMSAPAGSGALSYSLLYSEMESSMGGTLGAGISSGVAVAASATKYITFGNVNFITSSETGAQKIPFAATLKKLRINVITNTISATSTCKSRINNADGNQSVSITASTTGWFEDTSNTDSVSAGDLVTASVTGGASGTSLTAISALMDVAVTVGASGTARSSGYVF